MKPQNLFRLAGASILGALVFALSPALSAQTASTFVTSGLDKYRMGDYDGAIADYTKALDLNSSYLGAYNNRGMAKSKQGNFDGAIADYAQAIKMKPTFTDAYFNRGTAELLQGNFDAAIADCSKTIELKPDHQAAYFHRALAKDCQTNFEGASADYAKALELKGASDEANNYVLLHSALLGRRMGHPLDDRLKATTGWSSEWTKSLAMFLSDQLPEAGLMNHANATDGDEKTREQAEALYFSGVLKSIAGDKAAAHDNFQKCLDMTGPASLEHRLAQTELDRH
jgi:tetratricopeptide (TPR) repeat protein